MLPTTIDACIVTPLRGAVIGTCGELSSFLRIGLLARSHKVKVWLCPISSGTDLTMTAIMPTLPAAVAGPMTPARSVRVFVTRHGAWQAATPTEM